MFPEGWRVEGKFVNSDTLKRRPNQPTHWKRLAPHPCCVDTDMIALINTVVEVCAMECERSLSILPERDQEIYMCAADSIRLLKLPELLESSFVSALSPDDIAAGK